MVGKREKGQNPSSSVEETKQTGKEKEEMKKLDTDIDPELIKREAEKEKPYKMLAAVSFALLMLVIGVPLWWKTTEVYRAPVPYSEISALAEKNIPIPFRVEILWSENSQQKAIEEVSAEILQFFTYEAYIHAKVKLEVEFSSGKASGEQIKQLQALKDGKMFNWNGKNIQSDLPINIVAVSNEKTIYFGDENTVFVPFSNTMKEDIKTLLLSIYINEDRIREIVQRNLKERVQEKDSNKRLLAGSVAPYHSLDFYLVNPDPESCETRDLDMDKLCDTGLKPFYVLLEPVSIVQVKSQVLYYIDFPHKPTFDAENGRFVIENRFLPHLITPMEKYITSLEPEHPVSNFLIYITPPAYYPLFILDETGNPSPYNSFAIAGWGGVTVVNLPEKCNASTPITQLPNNVREGLISQLRAAFGLSQPRFPRNYVKTTAPLAQWELQRQMMHATIENLMVSTTTLRSLTKLLDEIRNIVINDEVAESIERAVKALELSFGALYGRDFKLSLHYSKEALVEAEKAFFDPSLLELLYFPDDQKYAIYIPLFLPVGAPVILSLRHLIKYAKGRMKKAKSE